MSCIYQRNVRDPIYGFIRIDKKIKNIVDHPMVQRLRWVNQLPLEQLVYPSANHSRFEHSLGVMHLAGIAASSLVQNSQDIFQEAWSACFGDEGSVEQHKEDFVLIAQICGLLHDVGHAPFSHTFEVAFENESGGNSYNHEKFGSYIVDIILEDIDDLVDGYKKSIKAVLNKSIKDYLTWIESICRKIIDYEFDVDKGDYLLRDSYHCGVNYGLYEHQRLWSNICLTNQFEIVPNEKAALEVWRLLLARYYMFENVYEHKFRLRTDAMLGYIIREVCKASRKANNQAIWDTYKFLNSYSEISKDAVQSSFKNWNDQSFIAYLAAYNEGIVETLVGNFFKRKILVLIHSIEILILNKKKDLPELQKKLWEGLEKCSLNSAIGFYIKEIAPPPIFNEDVNDRVRVIKENHDQKGRKEDKSRIEYITEDYEQLETLAKFLHFDYGEKAEKEEIIKIEENDYLYSSKLIKSDKGITSKSFRISLYMASKSDPHEGKIIKMVNEVVDSFTKNIEKLKKLDSNSEKM